jgi:hypothetical protein
MHGENGMIRVIGSGVSAWRLKKHVQTDSMKHLDVKLGESVFFVCFWPDPNIYPDNNKKRPPGDAWWPGGGGAGPGYQDKSCCHKHNC